jgi:general secretion pathway protein D
MIIILVLVLLFFHTNLIVSGVFAQDDLQEQVTQEKAHKREIEGTNKSISDDSMVDESDDTEKLLVTFSYRQTNIITIINQLAAYKRYNIIFPQGPTALNVTVSFSLKEPVTIDGAWNMLLSILDLAGYVLVPRGNNSYAIVKHNKDIAKEPYQTFIGVDPQALPDSVQMIRYVYYLTNIRFADKAAENDFREVFKVMMPADAIFTVDATNNALILVGKARDIEGFMNIVQRLDQVTFQEEMEIVPLHHANAATVAQMINEHFIKQDASRYRLDTRNLPEAAYINPFTKIIPIAKGNSVILLGTRQSIDRLRDFIITALDVDLVAEGKEAKSVVHIYELQYRDATSLAEVLKKMVESSRQGGTEQARGKAGQTGLERTFEEVIIMADRPKQAEELQYYGGNKLIVASSEEDWKQIKALIEELDTPEDHIFIEVLIADLLLGDTRSLSAQFRIPAKFSLPGTMEAQASHLEGATIPNAIIADPSNTNPKTINSDLLRFITPPSDRTAGTSLASNVPIRSTMISFNDSDGKTWGILNILNQFSHTKTLSHPHATCANNQKVILSDGQQRLLNDAVAGSISPVRDKKYINAEVKLELTPRIVGEFIYLQVKISINEFVDATNDTKIIREVETSVIIPNRGIFVCGGLTKTRNAQAGSKVPILGDLPLIGSLFSKKNNAVDQTSLAVFISPTIVQSKFQQEMHEHAADYIELAKRYSQSEGLFSQIKDPITRWFFKTDSNAEEALDTFIAEHTDPRIVEGAAQEVAENIEMFAPEYATMAKKEARRNDIESAEKMTQNTTEKHQEAPEQSEKASRLRTILKNEENPFESKKTAA